MNGINFLLFIIGFFIIIWGLIIKPKKQNHSFYIKLTETINIHYKFLTFLLFILLIFTSVYKLSEVPYGLHVDEAGMAYDALSLSTYGVDRFINKYPVYLINYGGGQSAMYTYLTAFLIKIFGYSTIIIRLPSVIIRILLSISIFSIIKDENNKLKNLLLLFLLTICPYFIMQSRWGLDCNLLVGFITISICIFNKALKNNNNCLLFISGLLFGLSLYTYALSYLIIPIFLACLIGYLLYIKKITFLQIIIFGIPLGIFALPLILMIIINNGFLDQINSFITIPKLPFYRGSEISLHNIPNNLYILKSILSFDNPEIFGNALIYNATKEFGTIYYFTIPFVLLGLFMSIYYSSQALKKKKLNTSLIFTILFFSVLIVQLLIVEPNINKANAIFICLIYFATQGIFEITKRTPFIIIPIFLILISNFIFFSNYYYHHYNNENMNQPYFATDYLVALEYSRSLKPDYIYLDNYLTEQQHIYILLNNFVSPYDYNTSIIKTNYENKEIIYNMNLYENFELNLHNNNAYIVKNDNNYLKSQLETANFKQKIFHNVTVFYKEQLSK